MIWVHGSRIMKDHGGRTEAWWQELETESLCLVAPSVNRESKLEMSLSCPKETKISRNEGLNIPRHVRGEEFIMNTRQRTVTGI